MKRYLDHASRQSKSGKEFLESLIDPIDWLSETIFSILILLLYIFAFRIFILSGAAEGAETNWSVNDLLIGAMGTVIAWGLIDGIMYWLISTFQRGERRRLLKDIQAAANEEEAVGIIADDLDYLLEPIASPEVRNSLYGSIFTILKNSSPQKIGLKLDDFKAILGHVVVAFIAVVPSLIPLFVFRYNMELAVQFSILVSFIVLFISGYRWGKYTGENPWKTGLMIMSAAVFLVLIAYFLEG
jgi:hypothetical protein